MKRSKSIDLNRMRKKRIFQLGSLSAVAGGATLLAGCGDNTVEVQAKIYRNLDICKSLNYGHEQLCTTAYRRALQASNYNEPKYWREEDCQDEFKNCKSIFKFGEKAYVPDTAGFLLASLPGSETRCTGDSFVYQSVCYSSQMIYEGNGRFFNEYYTGDGTLVVQRDEQFGDNVLDTDVDIDVFSTKHKYKKPLSRGGFGKQVIALTSSKSSRSSFSWGG